MSAQSAAREIEHLRAEIKQLTAKCERFENSVECYARANERLTKEVQTMRAHMCGLTPEAAEASIRLRAAIED